jgi:hypothetical protein
MKDLHVSHTLEKHLFYYETIKRELKEKPISECRCDERLKTKVEESSKRLSDVSDVHEVVKPLFIINRESER